MTITGLYNKVKSLDIQKISVDSLSETTDARVELNKEQLGSGLRSDGSDILPSYTDYTVLLKKLKGQETRFVTLKDSGAFWAGIKSNVSSLSIITDSTDSKSAKLKNKYETSKGKLFGLNKDSKIEYIGKELRPVFNKKIEEKIGLKMS